MFDFAQILYVGLRMGLTEKDIAHMYYGKWSRLNDKYRHEWNMGIRHLMYAEAEEKSVLEL